MLVTIRVTAEERERLRGICKATDKTVAQLFRERVLAAKRVELAAPAARKAGHGRQRFAKMKPEKLDYLVWTYLSTLEGELGQREVPLGALYARCAEKGVAPGALATILHRLEQRGRLRLRRGRLVEVPELYRPFLPLGPGDRAYGAAAASYERAAAASPLKRAV